MPQDQGDPAVRSRILSQVKMDLEKASRTVDSAMNDPNVTGIYLMVDEHLKTGGYLKGKLPSIVRVDST